MITLAIASVVLALLSLVVFKMVVKPKAPPLPPPSKQVSFYPIETNYRYVLPYEPDPPTPETHHHHAHTHHHESSSSDNTNVVTDILGGIIEVGGSFGGFGGGDSGGGGASGDG